MNEHTLLPLQLLILSTEPLDNLQLLFQSHEKVTMTETESLTRVMYVPEYLEQKKITDVQKYKLLTTETSLEQCCEAT